MIHPVWGCLLFLVLMTSVILYWRAVKANHKSESQFLCLTRDGAVAAGLNECPLECRTTLYWKDGATEGLPGRFHNLTKKTFYVSYRQTPSSSSVGCAATRARSLLFLYTVPAATPSPRPRTRPSSGTSTPSSARGSSTYDSLWASRRYGNRLNRSFDVIFNTFIKFIKMQNYGSTEISLCFFWGGFPGVLPAAGQHYPQLFQR